MPSELDHTRRSRARRVLGVLGAVVATTVTFTTAAAFATVVHLDVPTGRRLVATQVSKIANGSLAGKIEIDRIGHIGLDGLAGVRGRVFDPTGVQVVAVDGVTARVHALDIARSALMGKGPIRIAVDFARVGNADVDVSADETGALRLANAFAAKNPKPPPAQPEKPGRGVLVEAPAVEIGHLWAHGRPSGAQIVDAEIRDLRASAHVDPKVTRASIAQVDLVARALPRPGPTAGRLTGDVELPAPSGEAFAVSATYKGTALGIPVSLDGRSDGKRVDAVLDARSGDGASVSSLLGEGVRLSEETTAHAEVHGVLPDLDAAAHVALGRRGRVDVGARAHLGEDATKVDARIAARHVDLAKVLPSGPTSDLGLDGEGHVTIGSGIVRGDVAIDTIPGTLQGDDVPRVVVRAQVDGPRGTANVRVLGETAPIEADLALFPEGDDQIVEADVRATVPELAKLPGPLAVARGRAAVRATGRVALGAKTTSARVNVTGQGIEASGQHVDDVRVLASVAGPLAAPVVQVGGRAEGIETGGARIPSVDVRTQLELQDGGVVLRDPHVDATREDVHVGVSASRVAVRGPELRVEGAVIDGLGEPLRAEVTRRGSSITVKVDAPSLDLARVAAVAGRPDDVAGGTLSLATDLRIDRNVLDGSVKAKVAHASLKAVKEAGLDLDAEVHGREARIGLSAALGTGGAVQIRSDRITADGDPSQPSSWVRASGAVDLDGEIELATLRKAVPGMTERLSELEGRVSMSGAVRRATAGGRPDVRMHVKTRGLVVAGPVHEEAPIAGVDVTSVAPYRSEGLDVEVDAVVDAASDDAEIAVRALDTSSVIAALDAKAKVPLDRLLSQGASLRDELVATPVSARLVVPDRSLAKLPMVLGVTNVTGTVGLDLEASGTLREPHVALVARGRNVRSAALGAKAEADADVKLVYDGKRADLALALASDGGSVRSTTRVELDANALVDAKPGRALAWRASSRLDLAKFPLDTIGVLANRRVRGRATGAVVLDGLHENAQLEGRIDLAELHVGGGAIGGGRIELAAKDGNARADVRLDQKDGSLELHATTGLAWGADVAPTPDPSRPLEAKLAARAFRLAVLQPFVQGPVNGLDGRLDGDARVRLEGKGAQMDGALALSGGRAQVTALGQELRDIGAKLTFHPDGTIRVDDVIARGLTGEVRADAQVKLEGMQLATATANVHIPEKEKFDVALQGQPLGQVWADARIDAKTKPGTNDIAITVDIPKLGFILPTSTKSGVQELGPPEKIRVGTYKTPGRFVKLPLDREDVVKAKNDGSTSEKPATKDPTAIDLTVKLREAVIERGNMARVVIEGEPHVVIGEGDTQMSGQIRVRDGKVDVRGKKFDVERGTVTFTGDPANPTVVATASWDAADGTQVFADFVGPVKTGKVNLRSEPPRPKNEILALILFGTADGANPTPPARGGSSEGTAKTAVGLGGGLAAEGLTEALDDLAGIQAQARVDTTSSNNPRPELEVQLSPTISVEVSHVLGTPPIAEPDKNYASFNWRFRRNWSLETTFGDRGRALVDAIWQKRY